MKFTNIENAKIYIASYFRHDKESNVIFPDQVSEYMNNKTEITFEMYNDTFIYMIPDPAGGG